MENGTDQVRLLEKRVAHLEATVQWLVAARGGANKDTHTWAGSLPPSASLSLSLKGAGDFGNNAVHQASSTTAKLGAFSLRHVSDPTSDRGTTTGELEIRDKLLIRLLETVTNKYPGVNFDGDVLFLQSPFAVLVYPPTCLLANLAFLFPRSTRLSRGAKPEHADI